MLVDSGNLVNDLISEDFAKKTGVKYEQIEKKVGTAAKGGSVQIIGRSQPIKLFIENISQPVIIKPFVVRDLAHPINVGRGFLGRYQGKLEYTETDGYLDIYGQKACLIGKNEPLFCEEMTDRASFKLSPLIRR